MTLMNPFLYTLSKQLIYYHSDVFISLEKLNVDFYNFQVDSKNQLMYHYLVWLRRRASRLILRRLPLILNPYR